LPRKSKIRKIDRTQFDRLLGAAPTGQWQAFLWTAWFTGMRRNEMLDLTWDGAGGRPWIDFGRKRVWIPAEYNKADADQWLPLHPDLAAVLEDWRRQDGRVFALSESPREVSRKFTRLAKRAGLNITLHDLRRSFGSRYAPHVPAPVLKRLMRHADIKTTLEFYADVDDALDAAILKA
jgi:integrase